MIYLLTDNILFSSKIVRNLRDGGLGVQAFVSPDAMSSAMNRDRPELVLVNLNARGYDPIAIIGALKKAAPPYPVVAFCGHSDEETRRKGETSGADRVVANSAITMNAVGALRDAGMLSPAPPSPTP